MFRCCKANEKLVHIRNTTIFTVFTRDASRRPCNERLFLFSPNSQIPITIFMFEKLRINCSNEKWRRNYRALTSGYGCGTDENSAFATHRKFPNILAWLHADFRFDHGNGRKKHVNYRRKVRIKLDLASYAVNKGNVFSTKTAASNSSNNQNNNNNHN